MALLFVYCYRLLLSGSSTVQKLLSIYISHGILFLFPGCAGEFGMNTMTSPMGLA